MSDEERIHVEDESAGSAGEGTGSAWTEEIKVAGEELVETVKKLLHEAGVRRIVIKNKNDRTLIEIPLVLGLAGIALLPVYSALGLIAALVTDCSILVERAEKKPETAG
ncbi:MAG: DUF4342 domain-containing protein [Chloroflexi bacterium]|nr:DUF4342 domain-containing protein [Chloroflexota bacterium]MCI0646211.1 DUF4342 domain-containing protein [Chloroflexota bacterium]MCI0726916.1 DUF4342 domain-containing protein [Chloroflexota bacterium]